MPRAFSIAIQSDTVARRSPLPWRAPASVITRACRASASVSVDLPASGWLMTANVGRGRVSGTERIYRSVVPTAASSTGPTLEPSRIVAHQPAQPPTLAAGAHNTSRWSRQVAFVDGVVHGRNDEADSCSVRVDARRDAGHGLRAGDGGHRGGR